MQQTLANRVTFNGPGLHLGVECKMVVHPASANYGIWFKRADRVKGDRYINAQWHGVEPSHLCTKLLNQDGVSVQTIEHVMAALAGCAIHNALIEIDGPEVPILDGSALPFARRFLEAGIVELDAPVRTIEILRVVEVCDGEAYARLSPRSGFHMSFAIDFPDEAIGSQAHSLDMHNGTFLRELSDCRTFCRAGDVARYRDMGLIKGGTYDNAVVVDGAEVLSPGGLRRRDEAVRHKMLDALGDLFLAGGVIVGQYEGVRAGHRMTNELLQKLFSNPANFKIVEYDRTEAKNLPGVDAKLSELPKVA